MAQAPRKQQTVAIIGLGYVGLPLAVLAAEKGYQVIGVDHGRQRVRLLNRGINTLRDEPKLNDPVSRKLFKATTSYDVIRRADVVIICVPTPVDEQYKPDLGPIISAARGIARSLKPGQLIILESTVNPGVCEEVILPILEKSKLRAGRDFDLAHCPERINPGDPNWHVGNIPRCVGATTRRHPGSDTRQRSRRAGGARRCHG